MSLTLIGKKKGMTQVFDENGHVVVGTAIEIEANVVIQIKTKDNDGYEAVQLGSQKKKNVSKPLKGHFAKAKVDPKRRLKESHVEKTEEYQIGQEIGIDYFAVGDFIDVIGTTKGKGYQGVMKLHGFHGGPGAHGSGFHRHAGSTGMRSTPGRCLPGGKRASRMGGKRRTAQNLKIAYVDAENKLLIVKGAVPGNKGSNVYVAKAIKKKPVK